MIRIKELKSRRIRAGYSQHKLSKLAGMSRNRLSLLECEYIEANEDDLLRIEKAINLIEKPEICPACGGRK